MVTKTKSKKIKIRRLKNSIKFYLPRVEGYLEVITQLAKEFEGMSLIEFDGYFEKKIEPAKYMRAEVHTDKLNEKRIIDQAKKIRDKLKQKSLAFEINGELILVERDV
jgi:hypothetical protein